MLAAIILAAGESRRMGEPKALVRFGAKTFLETIVANFQDAGIEKLVVALGHDAVNILEKVQHLPVQFVINQNYSLGQFSSLQTGVAILPPETSGVFLALVDQPQIGAQVFALLKDAFLSDPQKIVVPTFAGLRGHPTILPRALFGKILSAPVTETAAKIIRRHSHLIREIQIESESILWNINTQEELAEIHRRLIP